MAERKAFLLRVDRDLLDDVQRWAGNPGVARGVVELADVGVAEGSGEVEGRLDERDVRDHQRDGGRDQAEHRRQRERERVAALDAALGQSLGPGRPQRVVAGDVEEHGPRQAVDERGERDRDVHAG